MPVTIVKVETNKQLKEFVRYGYRLYSDCPYYVPELYEDAMNTLRKDRNAAFEFCEADYFLAVRDGKTVGRIAAMVNRSANEKWGQNAARFGWVDFIDDTEVVDALFAAAEGWARDRGLTEIQGPLGFTDLDREGLLIEGEVPGASARDCGNYLLMNLPEARWEARKYLDEILSCATEENLVYPQ